MPGSALSEPLPPDQPTPDQPTPEQPAPPDVPGRVLVVVAHPDDIDFTGAGTLAGWTDAGAQVTYLLVTHGDQGGFDDTPREQVPALREREQRAAAAQVGVTDVRFLDVRDGHVEVDLSLRRAISRVIRQVRPDVVLTHNPERNWTAMASNHPDHMAVGEATLRAVYPDARNPFAFPELLADEGLEAWIVRQVWILSPEQVDHVVDITDQLPRKLAALRAHVSQTAHVDVETVVKGWNGAVATSAGLPEGRYAEAFRRVRIDM